MQATASIVKVRGPDGEVLTIEKADVLMGDLGLFIRYDEGKKLEMYVWENVLYMMWDDLEAIKSVWEEMLAELVMDAFDDEDDWDDDDEEEETPTTSTTSAPAKDDSPSADDPNVNPYGN